MSGACSCAWPAAMLLRSRSSRGAGEAGAWAEALSRWGLPLPDGEPLIVDGAVLPFAWRAHLAAAVFGPVADDTRSCGSRRSASR